MSSQERWDVVLKFLGGPLSYQGDVVCRGPVVRMGASPGPGGLKLDGYRGLDNRQATITAYDGASVAIAPVGTNQVRVAPHENVDWNEIHPIRGPVYLDAGAAFHLGPPGRGVSATFVECRRLGVWEKGRIISDAAQVAPDIEASKVKELDPDKGIPIWFVPGCMAFFMVFLVMVTIPVVIKLAPERTSLGPPVEGKEYFTAEDVEEILATDVPDAVKKGLGEAFFRFVMEPNSRGADNPRIHETPKLWDQVFIARVEKSVVALRNSRAFWRKLDSVASDYAMVVSELEEAGLPTILAAIPYQESGYNPKAKSNVCALGIWQFMPEVADRAGMDIGICTYYGGGEFDPRGKLTPPVNAWKNAPYITAGETYTQTKCRIKSCEPDDRVYVAESTRGAIELLGEAWEDEEIRASGSAVQLTILSHNYGYNDKRFDKRKGGVLPKLRKHVDKGGKGEHFYGDNLTCTGGEDLSDFCGGRLPKQTQHYGYSIVAQHFLAVCYYASEHGKDPTFKDWRQYLAGDGYCTDLAVPSREDVLSWGRG